jgi:hypothetical protein
MIHYFKFEKDCIIPSSLEDGFTITFNRDESLDIKDSYKAFTSQLLLSGLSVVPSYHSYRSYLNNNRMMLCEFVSPLYNNTKFLDDAINDLKVKSNLDMDSKIRFVYGVLQCYAFEFIKDYCNSINLYEYEYWWRNDYGRLSKKDEHKALEYFEIMDLGGYTLSDDYYSCYKSTTGYYASGSNFNICNQHFIIYLSFENFKKMSREVIFPYTKKIVDRYLKLKRNDEIRKQSAKFKSEILNYLETQIIKTNFESKRFNIKRLIDKKYFGKELVSVLESSNKVIKRFKVVYPEHFSNLLEYHKGLLK